MSGSGFTHLHLHTQYSLLDGAIRLDDLLPVVKDEGMDAVAVTDHGNMYGAVHFYKAAQKHGVKPILGCEAYVAGPKGRQDRTDRSASHLVLLAKDNEGYKNLSYLVSMGFMEGFYYHPRIDRELLRKHSKGLFGLSACLGGVVSKAFFREGMDAAAATAREYAEIFEPGHFFLEVQDNGYSRQPALNEALMDLAKTTGIPLVATADAHYISPADSAAHEVLMCIQQNRSLAEFRKDREHSDKTYVKSPQEMWDSFARVCPEAVENTQRIARECNVQLALGQTFLPNYGVPEGRTLESYLEEVAKHGLEQRFREARYPVDRALYLRRLEYELGVIMKMGFAGYFLIVWDFIRYAKEQAIPVGPGRGSGAGSLVAFALRITNLDPIPYDLLFERFLNPERVSMPDFDIDFCQDRRGEVIDYVSRRYGQHNVGQIVTYAALSAKSVIKDVGRVMEVPFAEMNELTKLIPNGLVEGKKVTIERALELEPKLEELREQKPVYKEIIAIARALEGLNRQTGMHAAGVVIGDKPLWEYVPICRGKDGELVTQFAKDEVELAGLVKFDFLGLKTLTVIANAVKHVRKREGVGPMGPHRDFDIEQVPLDDPRVYQLVASADTDGVFQLESSGFKELLKRLKPDRFEDIVAAVALYRPGPLDAGMVDDYIARKHGKKKVSFPHPSCEDVLAPTYGVIVYQEQVMRIAVALSGFTMGEADTLRKAMGKKKADVMAQMREKFVGGAESKSGMPRAAADDLFTQIEKFAGYAFNKCLVGTTTIIDAQTGERTTMGELYSRPREFTVHALGDDWRLRPRRVTDVIANGSKPVFELRTAQGRRITATGNHPFRTLDGWVHLDDLKPGDRIAMPRHLRVGSQASWPEHEIVALAGLLSEGNTCHPSCLYFTSKEPFAVADFAQAASGFANSVARIEHRHDGVMHVCVSTGRDTRFKPGQRPWNAGGAAPAVDLDPEPSRSGMFEWARALGILGKRAPEKFIPPAVFTLCDRDIELFLGRLWSGDGFIANATQAVPYYATASRTLACDVQTLLLRLGIGSGIDEKRFKYRGGEKTGYTVHVVGEGAARRFLERIGVHCVGRDVALTHLRAHVQASSSSGTSKDTIPAAVRVWVDAERRRMGLSWRELERQSGVSTKELLGRGSPRKRGFRRATVARLGEFLAAERLRHLATSDVFWDRVEAIEPHGFAETYDLTVEGDHNFVADGIIVHNSHSAAYAVVSYQTAYLKTYYPVEFMAALLSTEMGVQDNVVKYIQSARERGIAVLPPDVNRSERDFTVVEIPLRKQPAPPLAAADDEAPPPPPPPTTEQAILFGLGAVKGVGDSAIEAIIEGRAQKPFASVYGFCESVDHRRINRKALEALVKSGAMDGLGRPRWQVFGAIDKALEAGQAAHKDRAVGQASLFAMFAAGSGGGNGASTVHEVYPADGEWSDKQRLTFEKEALGFYITGHPLDRYAEELPRLASCVTSGLMTVAESKGARFGEVTLAGIVTALRERPLKDGSGRMAFVTLEDLHGTCEVLVFSKVFGECEAALKSGEPVLVRGVVQLESGGARGGAQNEDDDDATTTVKLRATGVELLVEARAKKARRLEVTIPVFAVTNDKLVQLKEILVAHKGEVPARLTITQPDLFETVIALPETLRVNPSDDLLVRVDRLFGQKVVKVT